MSGSIVVVAANTARLEHSPFRPGWILAGTPEARATLLAKSRDSNSYIMAWECTPGEFVWHYAEDETVVVLSGEAFVTNDAGAECRLAGGISHFSRAGARAGGGSPGRSRKSRCCAWICRRRSALACGLGTSSFGCWVCEADRR